MGLVEQLVFIIQRPHEPYHEHVVNILLRFVANHPAALQDCRQEKYGLRETLSQRKQYLEKEDPDAFQVKKKQSFNLLIL